MLGDRPFVRGSEVREAAGRARRLKAIAGVRASRRPFASCFIVRRRRFVFSERARTKGINYRARPEAVRLPRRTCGSRESPSRGGTAGEGQPSLGRHDQVSGPHLRSRRLPSAVSHTARTVAPCPKVGPGATVGDMGYGVSLILPRLSVIRGTLRSLLLTGN